MTAHPPGGAAAAAAAAAQGSPLGRRKADPAEFFRLTLADFEAVGDRYPALEDRIREVGLTRVRRACSPQCSPLRAARRRSSVEAVAGDSDAPLGAPGFPPPPAAAPARRRLSSVIVEEEEAARRAAEALLASLAVI